MEYLYLRAVGYLVCVVLFLSQCHNSLNSWLWKPTIITISKSLDQEKTYELPAITSCVSDISLNRTLRKPEDTFPYIGIGLLYGKDNYPNWQHPPNYSNRSFLESNIKYLNYWVYYPVPGAINCVSFQPDMPVPFGTTEGLHFLFNPDIESGDFGLLLYIHRRGFFFPSHQRRFGLNVRVLPGPNPDPSKLSFVSYALKVVRIKKLPRKEYPCKEGSKKDLNQCVDEYMELKFNCSLGKKAYAPVVNDDPCKTPNKSLLITNILERINALSTVEVMNTFTPDCYLPCVEYEYVLEKIAERVAPCPKESYPCTNLVGVEMNAPDAMIHVTEEQWLYTKDNFIADVGGYLGLLLGISVVSIYEMFVRKGYDVLKRKCTRKA